MYLYSLHDDGSVWSLRLTVFALMGRISELSQSPRKPPLYMWDTNDLFLGNSCISVSASFSSA